MRKDYLHLSSSLDELMRKVRRVYRKQAQNLYNSQWPRAKTCLSAVLPRACHAPAARYPLHLHVPARSQTFGPGFAF